ncbi:hypothetical protein P3T18_002929 [Paraburkholderia sp. GAS199]|uniref:hypothetical protein n=1 Tax=Paraburkholderia sp. GAS199 TaxID=3035126 RepID=UPI003D2243BA
MVTTRPCTATCIIDGMPVTLTFYPDNGVLRIADPTGTCIREMRWHASWRALLDEFRDFTDQSADHAAGFDTIVGKLTDTGVRATRTEPMAAQMALA